jgi:hypothetical protein
VAQRTQGLGAQAQRPSLGTQALGTQALDTQALDTPTRRTEQLLLIAEATRLLEGPRNSGYPTEVELVITMLERHERLAARRTFD